MFSYYNTAEQTKRRLTSRTARRDSCQVTIQVSLCVTTKLKVEVDVTRAGGGSNIRFDPAANSTQQLLVTVWHGVRFRIRFRTVSVAAVSLEIAFQISLKVTVTISVTIAFIVKAWLSKAATTTTGSIEVVHEVEKSGCQTGGQAVGKAVPVHVWIQKSSTQENYATSTTTIVVAITFTLDAIYAQQHALFAA